MNFQFIIIVTLLFLVLAGAIILFLFFYQNRVYKHKNQLQKMQEEYTKEMLQAQVEVQEQVLNAVGQEIHDNLGQMLSVIKINLIKLGKMVPNGNGETGLIEEIKTQVSGVLNDMRNLSKTLSQDFVSDFGLEKSLEIELNRIDKTGFIKTALNVYGEPFKFDGKVEIVLFRVCQELITNALKHSEANKLGVELDYSADKLVMTVKDDGRGFNRSRLAGRSPEMSGRGLINMENRVKIIGGVLNLESEEGRGTKATIVIKPSARPAHIT